MTPGQTREPEKEEAGAKDTHSGKDSRHNTEGRCRTLVAQKKQTKLRTALNVASEQLW